MSPLFRLVLASLILLCSCEDQMEPAEVNCNAELFDIDFRSFRMGFSTWNYAPDGLEDTYRYIAENADVYSEQQDEFIPWSTYLNGAELPDGYLEDLEYRVSKRPGEAKLLLSVSLLNAGRNDLLPDRNGFVPSLPWSDDRLIRAYADHLIYLIDIMNPDYLITAMEVNELYLADPIKWQEYKVLIDEVESILKSKYPALQMSRSVTLHNLYEPDVSDEEDYLNEVFGRISQMDFAAISFYPFFKGLHNTDEFQKAFAFINDKVDVPIAVSETAHLAEDLVVEGLDINIPSDECEQNEYLEVLLDNAQIQGYEFIIWWTHRDYDQLWATFPEDVRDLGQIWRDTGLLDESGEERKSADTWQTVFN